MFFYIGFANIPEGTHPDDVGYADILWVGFSATSGNSVETRRGGGDSWW